MKRDSFLQSISDRALQDMIDYCVQKRGFMIFFPILINEKLIRNEL